MATPAAPSAVVRTVTTAYRLTWIGCVDTHLFLKDCGPYFGTLLEAQRAAAAFNETRAARRQRPCNFILHVQYEPLISAFHPRVEILSLFLLDGTEIAGRATSSDQLGGSTATPRASRARSGY